MTEPVETMFPKLAKLYAHAVNINGDKLLNGHEETQQALDRLAEIFTDVRAQNLVKDINLQIILLLRPVVAKYVACNPVNPVEIIVKRLVHRYISESIKRIEAIFITLGSGIDLDKSEVLINLKTLVETNKQMLEQQINEVDRALAVMKN